MGLDTNNQELKVENSTNGVVSYKGQKYQVDDYGGVAEYVPVTVKISVGGTEKEITIDDDMSNYYGKVVTNYAKEDDTNIYRIFFIDFDGKFGDKGSIYLKSDCDEIEMDAAQLYDTASNSETLVRDMNPDWAKKEHRGNVDVSNWIDAEKTAAWLCIPTRSSIEGIWSAYYNDSTDVAPYINYIIGAPSAEMYAESYNQTHKDESNQIPIAAVYTDDSEVWNESPHRYGNPGYVFKLNGGESLYETAYNTIDVTNYGSMYCGGTNSLSNKKNWYLASPTALYDDRVCCIYWRVC